MADFDEEVTGGAVLLTLLLFVGIGVLVYLAVNKISWPESWYPEPIFDRFATWIDKSFLNLPGGVKAITDPFKSSTDQTLGSIGAWIDDNLPRTPTELQSLANDAATVNDAGNTVEDYEPDNPDDAEIETGA